MLMQKIRVWAELVETQGSIVSLSWTIPRSLYELIIQNLQKHVPVFFIHEIQWSAILHPPRGYVQNSDPMAP